MTQADDDPTRTTTASVPLLACLAAGVGAALVGLLPWLATGGRLPLQNLWAADTPPEEMPRALLPFSQYAITGIIGLLVTGVASLANHDATCSRMLTSAVGVERRFCS